MWKSKTRFLETMVAAIVLVMLGTPVMAQTTAPAPEEEDPEFVLMGDNQLALVRGGLSGAFVFEAEPFAVQIGRGGNATSQRTNTDLIVYDPFFTASSVERALHFDASLSDLRLGSGTSAIPGDDGDFFVENGRGIGTVWADGLDGRLILGTSTQDGDLWVRSSANRTTAQLDGNDGRLILGTTTQDGDIWMRSSANVTTITLDGNTGTVLNTFNGNGIVKGWARIAANGAIRSCYRCNASVRLAAGTYNVDFTPVSTNIDSRPRLGTLDTHGSGDINGEIGLATVQVNLSAIWVRTSNSAGALADKSFTVVIF